MHASARRLSPPSLEPLEQRIAPAVFLVTNTADSGAGSLRQAILDTNLSGNQGAADEIRFAIDNGAGVLTIQPLTPLPAITDPVIIDGYSQPGASPNTLAIGSDAVLRIELDGSLTANTTADDGLQISAGGSTVRGLIINRFHSYGISITDGDGNTIAGNWIGPNSDGLTAVTESTFGILISNSSNNLFGGATPADRNVVAGNVESFEIIGNSPTAGSLNNRIIGNYFGVGKDGVTPLGNDFALYTQGIGTIIGGSNPGEGNVISNTRNDAGIFVNTAQATGTLIQGNIIGLDATGTVAMGNADYGIIADSPNLTIGGGSGAGNIISSNTGGGMVLTGSGLLVQGNRIGTDITGALPRPNTGHGVELSFASASGMIGGLNPTEENIIAFNQFDGVHVGAGIGVSIRGNSIFSNGGLGINLGNDGVTPNDTGDFDTGANGLQNFPVLTSAVPVGASATINGTLNSAPGTYAIDFYASNAADTTGHGEGRIYLGSVFATVNTSGNTTFSYTPQAILSPGSYLTATATDGSGNTSEFSAVLAVGGGPFIWDGGGGADTSWFNPLNWDRDNGVPGATDTAILNIDATVTVGSDVQIGTLHQSAGNITGTATLSVLESFVWNGGTQSGAGVTVIDSAATLDISGHPGKVLDTRTLEVDGTAVMSGEGTMTLSNGATILNRGLFELSGDGDFLYQNGGAALVQFTNLSGGIVRKSGGTGMTEFGGANFSFNNSGWVDVETGTIRVHGSGGTGTGSEFSAAPGAVFEFGSGTYTFTGSFESESNLFFDGGGVISFNGATVNLGDTFVPGESGTTLHLLGGTLNADGNLEMGSTTRLEQMGGTLGGAGTVYIGGMYQWGGGTQSGTGTTLIESGSDLHFSGPGLKNLNQRTLEVEGTASVIGTGNVVLSNGATIDNTGLFDLQSDADFTYPNDGTPTVNFNNSFGGVLRKSGGSDASEFTGGSLGFNNSGEVDVQVGAIRFTGSGGGHLDGIFNVAPGAQLEFGGGNHSFQGGTDFQGGGQVLVSGGVLTLNAAILGGPILSEGFTTMAAPVGTLLVASDTELLQSGGTITGDGTLSIEGSLIWSGGTQSGTGVTRIGSGATLEISGAPGKTLDRRTLDVQGSVLMSGAGTVTLTNGASILNSGTFELQGDGDFLYPNNGSPAVQFTNLPSGILRKTSGTGVSEFGGSSFSFSNAGTISLQSGTVAFTNGLTQTAGVLALAGGALNTGSSLLLQGGELTGAGSVTGNVANNGGTIRPGGTGAAGTLSITGNYTQGSTGRLAVELGGTTAGSFDALAVTGTATLGGTLDVANLGGFLPGASHQFRVISSANNPGTFAAVTGQATGLTQTPDSAGLVLLADPALPAPDLVVTSNNGVTSADLGSVLAYTLQYRNDGLRGSTGVELTEILPAGTSFNAGASTAGWIETAPGSGIYKLALGTLASGASGSATFAVTVNSTVPAGQNTVSNSVSIADDGQNGADSTPANNSAVETDTLNVVRDLQVTMSSGISSAIPGATVSYTLSYQNAGNQTATGVVLTETLPTGTTFNPAASTAGWTETAPGSGVYTFNIGSVAGGANGSVIFAVALSLPATAGQDSIVNSVTIADDGSGNADPTPANNTDTETAALNAAPDLAVSITDGLTVATPGSSLSYTVTASNQGNQNATGVVLTMQLPAGTSYDAGASTAGWTETSPGSGVFTFAIGALAGGATSPVSFAVLAETIAAAGRDSIVGSVTISDDNLNGADPTPPDNTATDSTTLDAAPDLVVTVDNGLSSTTPGSALSYTLSYSNQGTQDATGVVLTQTLPAGTTFNAGTSTTGWAETAPGSGVYALNIGALAGTASGTATFAVTAITPAASGLDQIVTTVTIGDDLSNGADLTSGDNSATDSDTLNASPDLQVTIEADTTVAKRGGFVGYTVGYANTGNQNASGVFLTQVLPANTTFDATSSTPGWTETAPGSGVYRFDVGDLAASAQGSVIFTLQCETNLSAGTTGLIADASISDDAINGADPTPLDNTAGQTIGVYQGVYILAPGVPVRLKDAAPPTVVVFNIATGAEEFRFDAYDSTYRDSVRIAAGDLNGDGFDDIITSKRTGTGEIRVFDGLTGTQFSGPLGQIDPFDGLKRKTRGAFVASGDVTGDGRDDIIAGSALGGGTVNVYDGVSGARVTSYQPFGAKFKGGVRVATGDVNGDGVDEVIVGQGAGGSRVKVFDGNSDTQLQNFRAGPKGYRGGIFVASGDFDGDGKADILTGRDIGSAPKVETFSGIDNHRISSILAYNKRFLNGVRVSAADVNLDGIADIIATSGTQNKSQVRIFDGSTGELALTFAAFPEFPDSSLFVASSTSVPISLPPILQP